MRQIIVMLALVGVPTVAAADPAYEKCLGGAMTTMAMVECGSAGIKRADARLNAAWIKANARLEPVSKAALLAEQRAWLAYRDKSCTFLSSGQFGTSGEVSAGQCRMAVMESRAAQLASEAKDMQPQ